MRHRSAQSKKRGGGDPVIGIRRKSGERARTHCARARLPARVDLVHGFEGGRLPSSVTVYLASKSRGDARCACLSATEIAWTAVLGESDGGRPPVLAGRPAHRSTRCRTMQTSDGRSRSFSARDRIVSCENDAGRHPLHVPFPRTAIVSSKSLMSNTSRPSGPSKQPMFCTCASPQNWT